MESNASQSRPPSVDSVHLGSAYSGYFPSINHHHHHHHQHQHNPHQQQLPQHHQPQPAQHYNNHNNSNISHLSPSLHQQQQYIPQQQQQHHQPQHYVAQSSPQVYPPVVNHQYSSSASAGAAPPQPSYQSQSYAMMQNHHHHHQSSSSSAQAPAIPLNYNYSISASAAASAAAAVAFSNYNYQQQPPQPAQPVQMINGILPGQSGGWSQQFSQQHTHQNMMLGGAAAGAAGPAPQNLGGYYEQYYREYYRQMASLLRAQQHQAAIQQRAPLKFSRTHAHVAFCAHTQNRLLAVEPSARVAIYDLREIFTDHCYPHLHLQTLLWNNAIDNSGGGGDSMPNDDRMMDTIGKTMLPFVDSKVALNWIRIRLLEDSNNNTNYELKLILKVITMLYNHSGVVSSYDLSELLFDIVTGGGSGAVIGNSSTTIHPTDSVDQCADKLSQAESDHTTHGTTSGGREQLLSQLRKLLMRGQRRMAITFAQNNGLFDHAIALAFLVSFQSNSNTTAISTTTPLASLTDISLMIATIRKFIATTLNPTDPLYVFYSHLLQSAANVATSLTGGSSGAGAGGGDHNSSTTSSSNIPNSANCAKIESLESFIILLANDIKFDKVDIATNSLRHLIDLMIALLKHEHDHVLPDELFTEPFDCLLVNECLEFARFAGERRNSRLLLRKLEFAYELFDFGFVRSALNYCDQIHAALVDASFDPKCVREDASRMRVSRFARSLLPSSTNSASNEEEDERALMINMWQYQMRKMATRFDRSLSFDTPLIHIPEAETDEEDEDDDSDDSNDSVDEEEDDENYDEDEEVEDESAELDVDEDLTTTTTEEISEIEEIPKRRKQKAKSETKAKIESPKTAKTARKTPIVSAAAAKSSKSSNVQLQSNKQKISTNKISSPKKASKQQPQQQPQQKQKSKQVEKISTATNKRKTNSLSNNNKSLEQDDDEEEDESNSIASKTLANREDLSTNLRASITTTTITKLDDDQQQEWDQNDNDDDDDGNDQQQPQPIVGLRESQISANLSNNIKDLPSLQEKQQPPQQLAQQQMETTTASTYGAGSGAGFPPPQTLPARTPGRPPVSGPFANAPPPPPMMMMNARALNTIRETSLEHGDSFDSSHASSSSSPPQQQSPIKSTQQQAQQMQQQQQQQAQLQQMQPSSLNHFAAAANDDHNDAAAFQMNNLQQSLPNMNQNVNQNQNQNQNQIKTAAAAAASNSLTFFAPQPNYENNSAPTFDFMSTGQVTSIPAFDPISFDDNDSAQQSQQPPQQQANNEQHHLHQQQQYQQPQQPQQQQQHLQPNHHHHPNADVKQDQSQQSNSNSNSAKNSPSKNGGILSSFFGKFKPKNQAILPDDSNPTIVYDPVLKRWIDRSAGGDAQDANSGLPPPPPKMLPAMMAAGSEPNSPLTSPTQGSSFPNSQSLPSFGGPQSLPPQISPGIPNGTLPSSSSSSSNQFRSGLRKNRYIDVFQQQTSPNSSGSSGGTGMPKNN